METWIDLLVVLIAVVAVIVGAVTIARMFKQEDVKETASSDSKPVAKKKPQTKQKAINQKPSQPVFDKITKEVKKNSLQETVVEKLEKPFVPQPVKKEKVTSQPVNGKISKTTMPSNRTVDTNYSPPKLDAIQLSLDSPEKLLLKLKNMGDKLIYKKIKTGDHNELDIRYEPPARQVHKMREEFPSQSIMTFSLSGSSIISKTYQFTIYYGDMAGNLYTQIIAGMGKEYPIVDVPRKIA